VAEDQPPGGGPPPRQRQAVPLRQPLLEFLWSHVEQHLEFQCRVRWEPNTLVFWDNRATQHHAVWDYYPFSRYGERVSIVGSQPVAA
jgi:taurine dioxygenase